MAKKEQKILIIKACGNNGEEYEIYSIKTQAMLYGIQCDLIEPKTAEELDMRLQSGQQYDYIYLSSHGNEQGLCNDSRTLNMSWNDFAFSLCNSMCMNEDCILMLSCCRGGLNQVAYDLFYNCPKIAYVVGPRQSLRSSEMLIAYNIFLYNVVHRNLDPIVACEKIKLGTDIRFVCFDKLEVETEVSYMQRVEQHRATEQEWRESQQELQASIGTLGPVIPIQPISQEPDISEVVI